MVVDRVALLPRDFVRNTAGPCSHQCLVVSIPGFLHASINIPNNTTKTFVEKDNGSCSSAKQYMYEYCQSENKATHQLRRIFFQAYKE